MAAAERTARAYIKYRPHSALPLRELAWVLAYQDRFAQARAALQAAERIAPQTAVNVAFDQAALEIRAGHYPRADALVLPVIREGSARDRRDAEWLLIISLLHQGRVRAALPLVQRRDSLLNDEGVNLMTAIAAQLNLERGNYTQAVRLFNNVASHIPFPPSQKSKVARHQAFRLTNLACALFAAGDTTRLAVLADSIQKMGRGSGFGRDQRIHNHVRGMLWLARKQPDKAEAAFRAGVYSWMAGFTRTNYELGKLFISRGRARDAVTVLQPAFRGSLEGSNLYLGRTDLHELLAQAFDAAGQRDSAAVHYRAVVDAWRNADAEFVARRTAAAQRLALLTAH
jgi:tetratricopeptide (TPR) repeat protein